MFNYDSRFWKTFVPLLTMPGKVSRNYIDGKRVCYVNPFQLYLNVSIIFFLLIGLVEKFSNEDSSTTLGNIVTISNSVDSIQKSPQQLDSLAKLSRDAVVLNTKEDSLAFAELNDKIDVGIGTIKEEIAKENKPYEYKIATKKEEDISLWEKFQDFREYSSEHEDISSEVALKNLGYSGGTMNVFWYKHLKNVNKNVKGMDEEAGRKKFFKSLKSYIPVSLFVFLPIFTLFLSLVYIRRKYSYMEHLVFVFHTQTVFFLLFIIFNVLNLFVDAENVSWVFTLLFLIYLYKSLRAFYQQGRIKTIVKFAILNGYYMFLALIGFVIISVLTMVEA